MEDSGLGPEEKLDREKEEERLGSKTGPTLADIWGGRAGTVERLAGWVGREECPPRPTLNGNSTAEDLEDEIRWIRSTLVRILNEHTCVITICAGSKH